MKTLFVSIFMFVSAVATSAVLNPNGLKNPQIRVCVTNGGSFGVVSTSNDELPICKLGGATIGTQALIDVLWGGRSVSAVDAFLRTSTASNTACQDNGGSVIEKTDLCGWSDGSLIAVETLNRGNQDPENASLLNLLSK